MLDDRDQLAAAVIVRPTMMFLRENHLRDHDAGGPVRKLGDQAVDNIQQLLSRLLTRGHDGFTHPSIAPDGCPSGHSHDRPYTRGVNATTACEVARCTAR